jgi:hypothetical protein
VQLRGAYSFTWNPNPGEIRNRQGNDVPIPFRLSYEYTFASFTEEKYGVLRVFDGYVSLYVCVG